MDPQQDNPQVTADLRRWVRFAPSRGRTALRLFCLPYAGGSATAFRSWIQALPEAIEVCPIQLPGRENRLGEPAFTRAEALVETLARVLHPVLDRPFALLGHSMGARIAFALTHHLRRLAGPQPLHLFVSGARAPHLPGSHPIHGLPDREFKQAVWDLGGTPREVFEHEELMALILPTLRADFELIETYAYKPQSPLSCGLSAFGGRRDTLASPESVEAWRRHTRARFQCRIFEGDHFFLHQVQAQFLAEVERVLLPPHSRQETP